MAMYKITYTDLGRNKEIKEVFQISMIVEHE